MGVLGSGILPDAGVGSGKCPNPKRPLLTVQSIALAVPVTNLISVPRQARQTLWCQPVRPLSSNRRGVHQLNRAALRRRDDTVMNADGLRGRNNAPARWRLHLASMEAVVVEGKCGRVAL